MEKKKFLLYGDRFLGGRYRWASPEAPVEVELPAKIMRNGTLIDQPEDALLRAVDAPAAPLVDVRPKVSQEAAPPNVAQPVKKGKGKGGRAADK